MRVLLCVCVFRCVFCSVCAFCSVCVVEVGCLDVDHYLCVPEMWHQGGLVLRGGHHGVVESHLSNTQEVPKSKLGDVKSEEQAKEILGHFERDDTHMPTCMSCKTMEERNAASCTHMHGVKVVTW